MKLTKKKIDPHSCYLTNNCMEEWIPLIESNRLVYEVKKGMLIFEEGTPVKGIYFVYEGMVKVHQYWSYGKEIILRFATEGTVLGHRGLSTQSSIYPVSATALEKSTVCFIDFSFFEQTIKLNPQFTYNLMMFFADELQESERRMRNMVHMSVKGRLSLALLALKKQFGTTDDGTLLVELSKQDFASFIGTTYETLFRMLTDLRKSGIVSVNRRKITLNDLEELNRLAHEETIL